MNRPTRNTIAGAALCLVLAGFYSCQARAELDVGSGNYMLPHCEHYIVSNYRYDVWDGECGGVISALMFFGSSLNSKYNFCPPKGASNEQGGRVIIAYMKLHPELLHLNFRGL